MDRLIHKEGDFNKILDAVENAEKNQEMDKFDEKYAFVVCNEKFGKIGFTNLPQVKEDFNNIKRTTNLMNIKSENFIECQDVSCSNLNEKFENLKDRILG